MEIRTQYTMKRMKVKDLEIMKAYIIYDDETHENNLIIVDVYHKATILSNHSNEKSLYIGGVDEDTEVNVIGQVYNLDMVNIELDKRFK